MGCRSCVNDNWESRTTGQNRSAFAYIQIFPFYSVELDRLRMQTGGKQEMITATINNTTQDSATLPNITTVDCNQLHDNNLWAS